MMVYFKNDSLIIETGCFDPVMIAEKFKQSELVVTILESAVELSKIACTDKLSPYIDRTHIQFGRNSENSSQCEKLSDFSKAYHDLP